MNSSVKNKLKKKELIFDGFEQDFIDKENVIECPVCGGGLVFSLRNATYFNYLDEAVKNDLSALIKGVKKIDGRYYYKNSAIYVCTSQCNTNNHKFNVAFTFEEVQPARYVSWLIGVVVVEC